MTGRHRRRPTRTPDEKPRKSDHSVPANCPTYWDGCNCQKVIARLRAQGVDCRVDERDLYTKPRPGKF